MKIKNIQHINQALIRKKLVEQGFKLEVEKDNNACGYFFAYTRPHPLGVEWIHMSMWVNRMEIPWSIEREMLPEGAYIKSYFNGIPQFVDKNGDDIRWGHDGRFSFRQGEDVVVVGAKGLTCYFPHSGLPSTANYEKERERDYTLERVVDAESILASQGIAPGQGKVVIGWSNPFRL